MNYKQCQWQTMVCFIPTKTAEIYFTAAVIDEISFIYVCFVWINYAGQGTNCKHCYYANASVKSGVITQHASHEWLMKRQDTDITSWILVSSEISNF